MLNDDKPAIRLVGGRVYACGTPWSGKYDYSTPGMVPLAGICFLERAEENFIHPADTKKAVFNIFSQTVRKLGPNAWSDCLICWRPSLPSAPVRTGLQHQR